MDLNLIFSRFNPWWEEGYKAPGIIREKYLNHLMKESKEKHITFITGLRRVGKTTLLRQLIDSLLKEGIPARKIFFLSFDHSAFNKESVIEVVERYRELHELGIKEKIYLFFDEIQYHDKFEQDLKVLHDHENVKIFASGSNSLILQDRKAFLTGRHKNIMIDPLSFEEYLLFNEIKISPSNKQLRRTHFMGYLKYGGMPEYVLTKDPEKLVSLVKNIIYKDIVGKHKIRNAAKIEELFLLLCERIGKRLSYNKMAHITGIDIDTVRAYISYFEETFLIFSVMKHAKSLNEKIYSPRKMYIADNGIRTIFVGFKDKGSLLENLVFLKLKDKKVSYYYDGGKEIDFIVEDKKEKIAVEVKFKETIDEDELKFFNKSKFKKKVLVRNMEDFEKL